MDGIRKDHFKLIFSQHIHCPAKHYADTNFQKTIKEHIDMDVTSFSNTNLKRLCITPSKSILVSSKINSVENIHQVIKPTVLETIPPYINLNN